MQTSSSRRASDRRDSYRLDLESGDASVLTKDGRTISILDVSASGMSLLLPREAPGHLEGGRATINLGDLSFDSALDLVRVDLSPEGLRIGGRFLDLSLPTQRKLSSYLIRGFLEKNRLLKRLESDSMPSLAWQDPKHIEALLRLHGMGRQPLHAFDGGRPALHLQLREVMSEGGRRWLAAEETNARGAQPNTDYTVVMSDHGSIYHFRCTMLDRDGASLRLSFPEEIKQTGFRDSIRARLEDHGSNISFVDRHLGELVRPITDIGARGFSFEMRDTNSFAPGQALPEFHLELGDRAISGTGLIRSISRHPSAAGWVCGVEILDLADASDQRRWNEFVFHQTHPHVRLNPARSVPTSWALLEASDYLSGWTQSQHRARLGRAYANDWLPMSQENGHLLVLHDEVHPIGTVAGNRIYPKTWMVHHLGIDRDERTPSKRQQFLDYSRELYSGIMYMVQHVASADYFAIWVEQSKRWNELLYGDFVRSYSDGSSSLLTKNSVYKFSTQTAHSSEKTNGVEVEAAGAAQLAIFAAHLTRILPTIEVDAFSYSPEEIRLSEFAADCASTGYQRGRRVFLARRDGKLVAGLIAETGGDGTNVFGLLNCCRIIALDGELQPEVKRALLGAAIEHYRAAGKLQFVFVDDLLEKDPAVIELGFEHASAGVRWIVKREAIPGWLSYVGDIFQIQVNKRERPSHDRTQEVREPRAAAVAGN